MIRIACTTLALALIFAGCDGVEETSTREISTNPVQQACFVTCAPGYRPAPGKGCVCVPEPGRICEIMAKCPEGWRFSEEACGCLPDPSFRRCGDRFCGMGQVCCNASCSICTAPDRGCTKQLCMPKGGKPCGSVLCTAGEECCNASCSMCAPIGYFCIQIACEPTTIL